MSKKFTGSRDTTLLSSSVLSRISRSTSQTTGPKGDTGATGITGPTGAVGITGSAGATGATGADGVTSFTMAYYADFSSGISGSTAASGATGALAESSYYTSSDVWFPKNVIFYQNAASTNSNAATTVTIYVNNVAISDEATLSKLTGSGTYQIVNCVGGPVLTGTNNVHIKATGNFESIITYLYSQKKL